MNTKSFGLDIGATSIKAVSLVRQKNGFLLDASFIMPAPLKGILAASPIDEHETAEAIKKVVNSAKITAKNVNIALPDNKVYTNVVEMPNLSNKELSNALQWEAEQYIPVPLSEINLVWNVLKKDEKMRILMVGVQVSVISKYQKIIEMAGFNIASVETEILSVIRALTYNRDPNMMKNFPHTVIMNIGAENTSLAIIKEGLLIFNYSIPIGGSAINRALEADFGLSASDSEEYKRVYGISKEGVGGKIGMAIEPILTSILSELKKALAFYTQKYKDSESIRQIVLCGGSAKLPGIQLFFADSLGIETGIVDPWHVLESKNLPKALLDNGSDYAVAVGLAMRGYE
ncbi:MAG: hypothetical protein A3B41_01890 [Candidatus Levybacteria bacterium RIFCSPLOWO2_01_FULL_37_26]|nr:MAG: hypothetical protein A3E40_04175 [Candidatus Levybacteria bacterium RIFCSPHIGHO2_12_FULL_37_9]OGH40372.1 MAG: hypothetical protein A3B41_01890 [Candidatus Levybacteria bacterium RIFCSPLOWO2_01_FULL_37_26]